MALNEEILRILNDPEVVPMSLAKFISEEVREWRNSEQYAHIVEAERYYRNRSDVQRKTVRIANRSNTKIEHPILKKLIDQKADYLLSKPFTVKTDSEAYADALNKLFDNVFRRKVKSLGKGAVKSGIAWLQPYFDNGALKFLRIPSHEIIPEWKDTEHTELDAFIRVYDQIVYIGTRKTIVEHAEFWFSGGVKYFKRDKHGSADFEIDKEHGSEGNDWTDAHFVIGNKPYNFETPPIVWLKYNEDELPLCYFLKSLIDDVNWQTSITADVLRDIAKFIFVLKNYGGQDLSEFVKDLQDSLAIKVDADGGVDKLAADLNIDAVMAFLDNHRRNLFDYGAGVDTKDPDLGNASGTAINFRYMDLENDCQSLAAELQDTFQQLKVFIDVYLQAAGKGDFTADEFSIQFNSDMPVNEAEIITSIMASRGLVSDRTLLAQHPYVEDVDAELDQLKKEKEEALAEFGEGLFNATMNGDSDPQAGGVNDGDDE